MEYYIEIDKEKRGSYSLSELAERNLQATTLVMPAEGTQWVPAWQVEELRAILEGKNPADVERRPQEVPFVEATPIEQTAQQENTVQQQNSPKKNHTGCLLGILIALIALVAVLIITCPKPEQHKDALSGVITKTVNDAVNDSTNTTGDEFIDNAFRSISNAFAGKVIKTAVDNLVTVDNHIIYSTGKVNYGGKDHIVSLGLLGHIFTVDEDDLQEAAKQYYKQSEVKVEDQIKRKAQKIIQDNVVKPAASAIENMLGSALDGLLDDIGLGNDHSESNSKSHQPTDSIH
ncbi:GYF domain-containing protein [Prevotella histicola]|uniref:GYF domain-containing protein n=1 Tax=Prevotella histicola TaxID=470565 RepID=UPI00352F2F51